MARPETLTGPLRGVERAMLISSSDPAMLEVQSNFIEAARKAGVKHVVKLSGIMPALDSPFRFARMHGEIERRLEASGMAFTHLRAGEFMPAYFRQVPLIVTKGAFFLPMEQAKIASIDVGDIAEVAAIVLTGHGPECPHTPLMPSPSFLPSGAKARRHRFHRSSSQFWGDEHAASTSLQCGTRRSSAASDPHRKSDVSANFTTRLNLLHILFVAKK